MDMGKHTYSNELDLSFYIFQPILINNDSAEQLYTSKINLDNITDCDIAELPNWLEKFNHVNRVYRNLLSISLGLIETELFIDELEDKFKVNGTISLSNYINGNVVRPYLLYDYNTLHWMLCYEVKVSGEKDKIELLLNDDFNVSDNLYNTIRNIFVKELKSSLKSKWVEHIENIAYIRIKEISKKCHNITIDINEIEIPDNSGNITNMVYLKDMRLEEEKELIDSILELNRISELVEYFDEPIRVNHTAIYSFNGRFHTIFTTSKKDKYRYIPIQYHMQFMWGYLDYTYNKMDNLNMLLNKYGSDKKYSNAIDSLDSVINRVQYLRIFHENFKGAIQNDNSLIYSNIESKWNVENLMKVIDTYVDNFVSYLDRFSIKRSEKSSDKQNKLLFVISLVQLIALMSVWSDYMALVDQENIGSAKLIIKMFGSAEKLQMFNFYLPLLFIVVIIMVVIYTTSNKK